MDNNLWTEKVLRMLKEKAQKAKDTSSPIEMTMEEFAYLADGPNEIAEKPNDLELSGTPEELLEKAFEFAKLKQFENAEKAVREAIRMKPDYAKARLELGGLLGAAGRYEEAINALQDVIRIKPDYVEAHIELGFTFYRLGQNDYAIEACKQAIRLDAFHALAHYNLGVIYSDIGDKVAALSQYKVLQSLDDAFADKLFDYIYA